MEFRKMVTITLYIRQQKRHWCMEQSFGLCGRGRGWDDLGEWHWNMYNIMYETSRQSRFDARYWMLGAGALGRPRGMVWGGRREEGSGWGRWRSEKFTHFPSFGAGIRNQVFLAGIPHSFHAEIASVAYLQWSSVIYICSCLVSFFLCFSKMQQWYQVKEYSGHT